MPVQIKGVIEFDPVLAEKFLSPQQFKALTALKEHSGISRQAAISCGIDAGSFSKLIKRAEIAYKKAEIEAPLRGWSPEHDMRKHAPETHIVKGTSGLYDYRSDPSGKLMMQWVKTDVNKETFLAALQKAAFETFEGFRGCEPATPAPRTVPS